jgi:hypothetical protein
MAIWRVGGRLDHGLRGLAAACAMAVAGTGVAEAVPTIDSLPLAASYGSGVHSYFAGDYGRSYDDLSQAIEGGTLDPRAYYFRGLAALKLGRMDEAEADFTAGAAREAEGTGSWPIARSLERVQGCDRLKLERHRTRARVASLQENRRRNELRYLDVERGEADVLRRRRPVRDQIRDGANPFAEEQAPEAVPAEGALDIPAAGPGPAEEMPAPPESPANDTVPKGGLDPFGAGDGFGENVRQNRDQQAEQAVSEREDVLEQRDQVMERNASEFENAAGQRDAQAELDAVR